MYLCERGDVLVGHEKLDYLLNHAQVGCTKSSNG